MADNPPPPDDKPPVSGFSEGMNKLERELYARDDSDIITERATEIAKIGIRRSALPPTDAESPTPTEFTPVTELRAARRRKWWILGGSVAGLLILFGGAVGGTIWYRLQRTVQQDQIMVELAAPTDFTAGESITYAATFRNDSYVDWHNVEVTFEPPPGFRFAESALEPALPGVSLVPAGKVYSLTLGTIASREAVRLTVSGQLLGEQNATVVAKTELTFTPENFPSGQFTKSAIASTTISQVPVTLSVDGTSEAESGERLVLRVQVRNDSTHALPDAYLKVAPVPGVQLAVEDEDFSPGFSVVDSTWPLGTLEPLAAVDRQLVVFVEGAASERRTVDFEVGVRQGEETITQRLHTHIVTITASALAIEQVFNGKSDGFVVEPGTTIAGVLKYSNIGTTGLKDAVVKVAFEGNGLDAGTLKLPAGSYDPIARTITWTAASVPALATIQPQQAGEIPYEFTLLPAAGFPVAENGKNNILAAIATIDSPDLVTETGERKNLVSDRLALTLATTLTLEATAFYDDGRLGLTSEGPVPPKVGQQTTYTLRLRLGSTLNDAGDLRLRAVLPEVVRYTGQIYKTTGEVAYNDRSGEVLWTIPQVPGLTGRALPAAELHLQVAITPAENQVGDLITFINSLRAEAVDLFADETVSITVPASLLPTTDTATPKQGKVEP